MGVLIMSKLDKEKKYDADYTNFSIRQPKEQYKLSCNLIHDFVSYGIWSVIIFIFFVLLFLFITYIIFLLVK